MKIYIGIDNGLKGGITIINSKDKVIDSIVMPTTKDNKYDIDSIVDILKGYSKSFSLYKDSLVIIETAHPRPISGKRACFMNGYGFGVMKGVLTALGFNYIEISPSKWMKDLDITSKDKKGSIEYCLNKYPERTWKATQRCTTNHDGMTDSCCIAIWGKINGGNKK